MTAFYVVVSSFKIDYSFKICEGLCLICVACFIGYKGHTFTISYVIYNSIKLSADGRFYIKSFKS